MQAPQLRGRTVTVAYRVAL